MKQVLFSILFLYTSMVLCQSSKDQLIGRVLDIYTNRGIEGVQVELITDKSIVNTNNDGVFIFNKPNGYEVGNAYSFNFFKEGYLVVGHTDNIAMYSSGAINDFAMKPDTDNYLWLTIVDGATKSLLKDVQIQIKDSIKTTNSNGLAKLDLKAYRADKIKAIIRLNCYYDKLIELDSKGEVTVELTPNCKEELVSSELDISSVQKTLDRALKFRDGSLQGQVRAIETLLSKGYIFKNSNFDGVAFPYAQLNDIDLTSSSFQVSNLQKANLLKSKLNNSNLNFANVESAIFDEAVAKKSLFQYVDGKNVTFKNADLFRSSFFLSDLSGSDFSNANLKGACLAFCNLTGADFSGADLTDAFFYGSVLNNANFKDAIVKNTEVSIAVADTIHFTDGQRKELRRIAPPSRNIHQLRIWGKTSDEKGFNYKYPDFELSDSSFDYAHFQLSTNSLSFRDDEGLKPVGAFNKHGSKKGSNVNQNHRFNSNFWKTANRGSLILKNLTEKVAFLKENLWKQKIIEGTGEEMEEIMNFLQSKKSAPFKGPLIWNHDAQLVFSIASGIRDASDIKHYEWERAAKSRCELDKIENRKENSWDRLYPKNCPCNHLPYEHLNIYKKWTLNRSKRMNVKKIEIAYPSYVDSMDKFLQNFKSEEAKNRGILFYRNDNADYGISRFFHNENLPNNKKEIYINAPGKSFSFYLKLPKNKLTYYIDLSDLQIPKLKRGKISYGYPLEFIIQYVYDGVSTLKDSHRETDIMLVTPIKVKIKMDGTIFWEGKIHQTDETLFDPTALRKRDY